VKRKSSAFLCVARGRLAVGIVIGPPCALVTALVADFITR